MNLFNEIGGYLELELLKAKEFYPKALALSSARNCLRYIIRAYNIKEIYVPYFTCEVVYQAIKNENCSMKFYHIDKDFLPTTDFNKEDFILYTNYFGICAKNVELLCQKYPNLIVDNAQAFYMHPKGLADFNSPRKFFGVPDGGYLFCKKELDESFPKDLSYKRFSHLIKRLDVGATKGYMDFKANDASLDNEPVKFMSNLTKRLLSSIDYEKVKNIRLENFNFLHNTLKEINELKIELTPDDVPMVYPYLIKEGLREKLINNNIYVATYWQPLDEKSYEAYLRKYLLPLPIDQRYSSNDMQKILGVINE